MAPEGEPGQRQEGQGPADVSETTSVRRAFHALWLRGLRASALRRYGVGVVAAVGASLIRILLNPFWGTNLPYISLFPATLFTALFGGLAPAWVGIAICTVMATLWILPPSGSFGVPHALDLVGLGAFIVADGIIAWIGALHRDLIQHTERQSAELGLRKREAEAANRAKDDFLAVLSHELRSPLTTILAGVRVLHQIGSQDASVARVRDAIERQADQLTRLVDDLLDVKRIVTGPVALQRQPFNLADAVAGFIAAWNGAGRFNDHKLLVDTEPVWVDGDADRLQQVVDNLISNAIKYTPAGGSISMSIKPVAEEAVLRVQDTGIGISPDLLPKVFELFMQGDPGSTRVRTGLGIGLAVVHRIVELHGGTAHASSDGPGTGSTFTIHLPRVPPPSGAAGG